MVCSEEYSIAYKEVYEILKYVKKDDYDKIPEEKIKAINELKNDDYIFEYDPRISLEEQGVSKTGMAMIAIFFRDYWATEEQKSKIIEKQKADRIQIEQAKKELYNKDIFKENKISIQKAEEPKELIVIEEKKSIFEIIIDKIKNIFKK